MSMIDAFFNKGFKGLKCKTLLKLTIPRIKLLRNRREIQLKQMRRDIAKLLENGQEATARIRVEHIIREENMMAAQEIIELFCELISVRIPMIETQRECPLDLKEAISSICFAAPRCSDLPELQQVQMLFAAKYGREFVAAAAELMPDCGVNRQMIELLSVRAPSVETKLKLLKEIAEEHEIEWDPAATETEFLKPHEDLLNGPTVSPTLPLPKESHDDDPISSDSVKESRESPDSEADLDFLDLPEVPTAAVRTSSDVPSAPDLLPPPSHSEPDTDSSKSTHSSQDAAHIPSVRTEVPPPRENKQFVPFVSSPSLSAKHSEANVGSPSLPAAVADSDRSRYISGSHSGANVDSPSLPSVVADSSVVETDRSRYISRSHSETNVDLQDVLAAAHAAAESAERAATSARAAASLAQVRISELITKRNGRKSDGGENELEVERSDHITRYEDWDSGSPNPFSHVNKMAVESPDSKEQEHQLDRQPQRSVSLEDEPIFSYPNLFSSQKSDSQIR